MFLRLLLVLATRPSPPYFLCTHFEPNLIRLANHVPFPLFSHFTTSHFSYDSLIGSKAQFNIDLCNSRPLAPQLGSNARYSRSSSLSCCKLLCLPYSNIPRNILDRRTIGCRTTAARPLALTKSHPSGTAVVTLLLHGCYTVVTLLSHCCYTVVTPLFYSLAL
jgi:hypothetical protein